MPGKKRKNKPVKAVKKGKKAKESHGGVDKKEDIGLDEILSGKWLDVLGPILRENEVAHSLIGKNRSNGVFPVRELTFRALQANTPEKFKVVIFGEAPFPRLESNTGIALFDGKFKDWNKLGRCASLRAMLKAICLWKEPGRIHRKSKADEVRKFIKEFELVQVPEWFQATLTQGCLWLNTSLTAGGKLSKSEHQKFWRPIMEEIIRTILSAKDEGCVFALWGKKAQSLRKVLTRLAKEANVQTRFVEGWNPAASGYGQVDFCDRDNFGMINDALEDLGLSPIDWFPTEGWEGALGCSEDAERLGGFIQETEDLLKTYLERIGGVAEEAMKQLAPITGISEVKLCDFKTATSSLKGVVGGPFDRFIEASLSFAAKARRKSSGKDMVVGKLTIDQIAAIYLYTTGSNFYRKLNAGLRDPDRNKIKAFFPYLRLLLEAFRQLEVMCSKNVTVWRGVKLDLRDQYKKGSRIVWWGVSSCTIKRAVAEGFMGSSGTRMLFRIGAKCMSIRQFSAFAAEDEYVLLPGTQLDVVKVSSSANGCITVDLKAASKLEKLVG